MLVAYVGFDLNVALGLVFSDFHLKWEMEKVFFNRIDIFPVPGNIYFFDDDYKFELFHLDFFMSHHRHVNDSGKSAKIFILAHDVNSLIGRLGRLVEYTCFFEISNRSLVQYFSTGFPLSGHSENNTFFVTEMKAK